MKKTMTLGFVGFLITVSGVVDAQQQGREQQQRPVSPVPPSNELFYRTFTASQLGQADQREPVKRAGKGAPATVPNTANVVEEIFRRGLGPIVLGLAGQRNADGSEKPYIVLTSQADVYGVMNPTSRGRGVDVAVEPATGRQMSQPPSENFPRLQRNLVALKVNMIICGNGITVNDPGDPFRDLFLARGFDVAEGPIYDSCIPCWAECPGTCSYVFMKAGMKCRCYLPHLDPVRASSPRAGEGEDSTLPRRLKDLAAYADNMLTNLHGFSEDDFEEINLTIEIVNGAFASALPFGPEDIVQWGGRDGRLILTSVRPLSDVPFLVNQP